MDFNIYTVETAPADSQAALVQTQETFGFIPNLEGIFAEAPALLKGSMALWDLFATTSFNAIEQQIIYLTANYENECGYCMAAHTGLAKMVGMPEEDIQALRTGKTLQNAKLQALREFTRRMVSTRGWVSDHEMEDFLAAGYTKQQVLEVILGIAIKVMHNYTNHIAKTPLDREFKAHKWSNGGRS